MWHTSSQWLYMPNTVDAVEQTPQLQYFSLNTKVIAEWPWKYRSRSLHVTHTPMLVITDLKDTGQCQRPLQATHPHMPVTICAKYRNNPSRTASTAEQTRYDVPYFNGYYSKVNGMTLDIGSYQKSSHASDASRSFMLVIICAKYGENPIKTVGAAKKWWITDARTDRQTDKWESEFNIPH